MIYINHSDLYESLYNIVYINGTLKSTANIYHLAFESVVYTKRIKKGKKQVSIFRRKFENGNVCAKFLNK